MLTPEQMSQELKGMGGDKTRSLPCCQSLWRKIVLFLFSSHKVKSIPLSRYFQVKSNLHPGFLAFSLNWLSWSRIHLQCRRPGFDPCVGKIPWRRKGLPTPVFWPGEFQGLYRPLGRKESDMTGRLSLHSLTQSKLAQTRNGESEARNLITVLGKIVFFKPAGSLGFPGGSDGKASACNVGNRVRSLGWEDALEKGKATHSSIFVWRIPWKGKPVGYSPCGCRVGHNWATNTH